MRPTLREVRAAVIGAIASLTVASLGPVIWKELFGSEPSLRSQLDEVLRTAAKEGETLVFTASYDLRGDRSPVRLLEFRDNRGFDLRLYERRGDRLHLAFRYRSDSSRSKGGELLRFRSTRDFDGSGRRQLYGALSQPISHVAATYRTPVVLYWDEVAGRYRLQTILTSDAMFAKEFRTRRGSVPLSRPPLVRVYEAGTGKELAGYVAEEVFYLRRTDAVTEIYQSPAAVYAAFALLVLW